VKLEWKVFISSVFVLSSSFIIFCVLMFGILLYTSVEQIFIRTGKFGEILYMMKVILPLLVIPYLLFLYAIAKWLLRATS
jgi:hypothetical protein